MSHNDTKEILYQNLKFDQELARAVLAPRTLIWCQRNEVSATTPYRHLLAGGAALSCALAATNRFIV
jgi:hypothetical protein